jgi:hypothetical protein
MGIFRQICSLAIEHEFFGGGQCKHLRFVPSVACAATLRRTGLILRAGAHGAALYGDGERLGLLREYVAEAGGALKLTLLVTSVDPHFPRYTLPAADAGRMLFFDSRAAHGVDGGARLLHAAPAAGPADLRALDDPELASALAGRAPGKPAMIVQLVIDADAGGLCAPWHAPLLRHYAVRLAAGSTRWKYLLMGELAQRELSISDASRATAFQPFGSVVLPGRQVARMFLSDAEIPMRETPGQRFQLREHGGLGEKVLIKRMPTACVGRVFRELVGEHEVLVSEIYINQ